MHPHFKLQGIEPGRVYTARFGFIDFRNEVSLEILQSLYDSGFPYLKLTVEGRKAGKTDESSVYIPTIDPASVETLKTPIPKSKKIKNVRKSSKMVGRGL